MRASRVAAAVAIAPRATATLADIPLDVLRNHIIGPLLSYGPRCTLQEARGVLARGKLVRRICKRWCVVMQGIGAYWGLVHALVSEERTHHEYVYKNVAPHNQDSALLAAYEQWQGRDRKESAATNRQLGVVKRKINNREEKIELMRDQVETYKRHRVALESEAAVGNIARAASRTAARKLRVRIKAAAAAK